MNMFLLYKGKAKNIGENHIAFLHTKHGNTFTSIVLLGINFDSLATLTATGQTHIRCLRIFVPHLRICRAGKKGVRFQFHKHGLFQFRKHGLGAARELFRTIARLSQAKKLTNLVEVMEQKASETKWGSPFRPGEELIFWVWRNSDWWNLMTLWNSCTAPKTSSFWKINDGYFSCHQATTNASPGRRAQAPRPTWKSGVKGSKIVKALTVWTLG